MVKELPAFSKRWAISAWGNVMVRKFIYEYYLPSLKNFRRFCRVSIAKTTIRLEIINVRAIMFHLSIVPSLLWIAQSYPGWGTHHEIQHPAAQNLRRVHLLALADICPANPECIQRVGCSVAQKFRGARADRLQDMSIAIAHL